MAKKGGLGGLGLGRGLDALMGGSSAAREEIAESTQGLSARTQAAASAGGASAATDAGNTSAFGAVARPSNIPDGIEVDENGGLWVDPALLIPNPKQPRTEFDSKALEELCDSIKEHGIVQPIIIEKADGDNF